MMVLLFMLPTIQSLHNFIAYIKDFAKKRNDQNKLNMLTLRNPMTCSYSHYIFQFIPFFFFLLHSLHIFVIQFPLERKGYLLLFSLSHTFSLSFAFLLIFNIYQ
ncbi:uncharacterized protein BX664DRAFT_326709 [Halteromyces radiatus]|uniref:uncharacterized protein n=1 Tax=Halteromyces radiatus TaxID=101107 RepID=UPI00222010CE|nr:uncharacterized protein BX664DRAFT_326709 [Halteromyces radiatus]KAI8097570.1 hypothetical protein BX664DRAFT_326709 [Halteromyces radiatus]